MNYRVIDMEKNPRAGHFAYFRTLANPFVTVTCRVNVTDFVRARERRGDPFFLSFQYCAANALNRVPELRRRVAADGRVLEFDYCIPSHTLMHQDGSYSYCCTDPRLPFPEYLEAARREQARVLAHPTLDDGDELTALNLIYISSLHWLDYTSLALPFPIPADTNPRLSWGKAAEENGSVMMPVTLMAHHGLADGLHLAAFFRFLEEELSSYAAEKD